MTMDTYKKKYKEALERARVWKEKSGMPKDKQGILDDIFPELKESEDEKIRKSLIILLQHFCKGYRVPGLDFPVSYKDMLAWLEKQGEQKPTIEMKSAEESLGIDSETYNEIVDECIYGEQKSQRMISAEAKEAMYDKPAWSEEEEVKINRIVACLENLKVADNDILLKDVDWLKSLKTRYTWKPSDEQMANLWNMLCECRPADHQLLQDIYYGLKKLR